MHITQSTMEKIHWTLDSISLLREDLENLRKIIEEDVPTISHSEPEVERHFTKRGFEDFTEFRDSYGSLVTVRESSSAEVDAVWIFCKDNPAMENPSPHLDTRQARKVAEALLDFADRIEAEALVEAGRGRLDNLKTAADFNAAQGKGGFGGHDALNRSILVKQRCKRLGVPTECPTCSGNGYVYTSPDCRLGLILWYILPRKGASRGWEIKNVLQSDLPAIYEFLAKAAKRNQERFAKVIERAAKNIAESVK